MGNVIAERNWSDFSSAVSEARSQGREIKIVTGPEVGDGYVALLDGATLADVGGLV